MANPLALLGLLAIAVPLVIHLLDRYHSRVERFPTLRFIGDSRLNPTSRRRLSDIPLLLVRMALVAVAALALTQPSCSGRPGESAGVTTRVVIVDTSASMSRLTPNGPVASVIARQVADRESAGALTSRIETDAPASALPGAVAFLSPRAGLREIVIVSDFQRGTVDSTDLAAIPESIGLTLAPIATTSAEVPRTSNAISISTFAGPGDADGADASWRAIGRRRPTDTTGRIAIIYRGFAAAPRLHNQAFPVDSPWMARIVTALGRDRTLAEAAATARSGTDGADTVVTNRAGKPVLLAGRNEDRLQFEMLDDAGSLFSTAFNAALLRAVEPRTPGAELDSAAWTAEDIGRWQRAALPFAGDRPDGSDGRWFWLACLALIGVEYLLRARARVTVSAA